MAGNESRLEQEVPQLSAILTDCAFAPLAVIVVSGM